MARLLAYVGPYEVEASWVPIPSLVESVKAAIDALTTLQQEKAALLHGEALIEARTQRGITDCSTPLHIRVENIVAQLEQAERELCEQQIVNASETNRADIEMQRADKAEATNRRLREALADIYHRWAELQMDKDSIAEDVRQFYVAMDSIPAVLTPPPAQECRINNLMDSNGPRCVTHDRPLDWVECTGWRCEVSGKIVTKGGTDDPGTD